MIDRLQKVAVAIRFLRLPAILIGLSSLLTIIATLFLSRSHAGDILVIPAFIGLAWGLSGYSFITAFQGVPEKPDSSMGRLAKLRLNLTRVWYWLIGLSFLAATMVVFFLSYRMVMVWIREYG